MSAVKPKKIVRPLVNRPSGPWMKRRTKGGTAPVVPLDLYAELRSLGRMLDDIERARIQTGNRLVAYARFVLGIDTAKEDVWQGKIHAHILEPWKLLEEAERRTVSNLETAFRSHPLRPFAQRTRAVGDKTLARLLAETGDPTLRAVGHFEDEDSPRRRFVVDGYEPRTLDQFRQFCGHGDPKRKKQAPRRNKEGEIEKMSQEQAKAMGSPHAKKRVHLVAEAAKKSMCAACRVKSKAVKADGNQGYFPPAEDCSCAESHPLRHAYNVARAKYATRVHDEGPRIGQPWTDGHQDAAAMRYVGKVFLKMLYDAAKDVRPLANRPSGPSGRRRAEEGDA